MDIIEAEYEELRRLDRLRSDNAVLHAWLTIQHAEFPDWAEQAAGTWDFSLGSLARLEDLIRGRYTSADQAHQDEGGGKLTIRTAPNTAFTGAVRSWPDANPAAVDPRTHTAPGRDARAGTVSRFSGAE
ncbi:hypothetical protein [Streptomyces platensis]|uniref:hypothetical protein n=1 Tax=Streptomyces platensis TaxID=58346 RepID=UPI0037B8829D